MPRCLKTDRRYAEWTAAGVAECLPPSAEVIADLFQLRRSRTPLHLGHLTAFERALAIPRGTLTYSRYSNGVVRHVAVAQHASWPPPQWHLPDVIPRPGDVVPDEHPRLSSERAYTRWAVHAVAAVEPPSARAIAGLFHERGPACLHSGHLTAFETALAIPAGTLAFTRYDNGPVRGVQPSEGAVWPPAGWHLPDPIPQPGHLVPSEHVRMTTTKAYERWAVPAVAGHEPPSIKVVAGLHALKRSGDLHADHLPAFEATLHIAAGTLTYTFDDNGRVHGVAPVEGITWPPPQWRLPDPIPSPGQVRRLVSPS